MQFVCVLDLFLIIISEHRYLTMQLHYKENIPDDFESPGFVAASATVLRIEKDRGWYMADTDFGSFKTSDQE